MNSLLATIAACVLVATIAATAAACQATQDPLDAPPPSITPALVNVTPSPTRTPIATSTPRPTATPSATATTAAEVATVPATSTATATATSQPDATRTPLPTPTPTPRPPTSSELTVYTFIFDLGLDPRTAEFTNISPMTWPDLSLGCGPREGNVPAVDVDGYVFNVSADGNDYVFHVAEYDDDTVIVDCTDAPDIQVKTLNPTAEFGLDAAQSIVFARTDGEGGYVELRTIADAAMISQWTDALDIDLPIGNDARCETVYKLEFATPSGTKVIDFFCESDWFRIGGQQPEWDGTQGAMPPTMLNLIAPILAAQPFPEVPELDETVEPQMATATPTPVATPTPTATPTPRLVNPTQAFGLDNATSVVFSRINADNGYDPVSIVEGPALSEWTDALDANLRIGITEFCDTIYRMEFRSDDATHTIDFFCEDDWYRIGGDQTDWYGTQGQMPRAILDLIAPILSAQPLPELPADSDE